MKVLLSAAACNPELGSESHFGWTAARALARDHEVWVLTHEYHRPGIERAAARGEVSESLRFAYEGHDLKWHPNMMIARIQSWLEAGRWTRAALPLARALHRQVRFDVAHHLTLATWRVASPLWKLGIPFVWGPLGGGEMFPPAFGSILSRRALLYELVRGVSNFRSRHDRAVVNCARRATHILASNRETRALLERLRGSTEGINSLSAAFFPAEQIERFGGWETRDLGGPLKLFGGGILEGRKGVALALRALGAARREGVSFTYRLGGGGPERAHLSELAHSLGIADSVRFDDNLDGEAYVDALRRAHVYLLPSLRENAGVTLMEAMLAGCVPVVARCGGPGEIVSDPCGHRIPVESPEQMVRDLGAALCALDRDRAALAGMGEAARDRIRTHYSEAHYVGHVNALYRAIREPGGAGKNKR